MGGGARPGAPEEVNAIMDELAAIGAKAILASDIRFAASDYLRHPAVGDVSVL